MARDNRRFKAQVNRLLDRLAEAWAAGGAAAGDAALGSEAELAQVLEASRTTVRAVLAHLAEAGVLAWDGREKRLLRAPLPGDYFDVAETRASHAVIEERFLQWVLKGDVPPETVLNESQLARQFDMPLAAVREFLIRFEPFGLIEKTPNRHWVLKGFTRAFAEEMFDVRLMFERRALARLIAEPEPALIAAAGPLAAAHRALIAGGAAEALAFPELDARFHAWICAGARNRFIADFSRTIAIIVHYHYLWNKKDEVGRNRDAAAEHLEILAAVSAGDGPAAMAALERHLATARRTLLASVLWPEA